MDHAGGKAGVQKIKEGRRGMIPIDQDQRHIATTELDRNLVVLAGAGTGKTTLLIDRLIMLILGKGLPVEQVVALTFTKKAAEEMRERLEVKLRTFLVEDVEAPLILANFPESKSTWKTRAEKALQDIPKAQLGTIHSFAGHVLRLFPLQAGVDPKFREDDGHLVEEISDREWLKWIAYELGDSSPRFEFWKKILLRVSILDLKEMASVLLSPMIDRKQFGREVNVRDRIREIYQTVSEWKKEFPVSAKAYKFGPALDAFENVLQRIADGMKITPDDLPLLNGVSSPPESWDGPKEELKSAVSRVKALFQVDEQLMAAVLTGLEPFIRLVETEMARLGVVTFDGLLVYARNVLRDHVDVRVSLKKKFATFLVDEFQDTDPLQGEILFYLSEKLEGAASHWNEVDLEPGRLFVVGDPKQSIYRFRGADIAAFEAFQDAMEKQGALRVTLSANFRSKKEILDFVNALFPKIMIEKKHRQSAYSALEAGRVTETGNETGRLVTIVEVSRKDGEKLLAEEGREAEADAISQLIVDRKIPFQDVVLLFRSANSFFPYLEALRRKNIPYVAEGEKTFYRSPEVIEFLNLLALTANPKNKMALVGVLRSPLGCCTDEELLSFERAGRLSFEALKEDSETVYGRLLQVISETSKTLLSHTVSEVIADLFEKTCALELATQYSYGEQALANLRKVHILAKKWADVSPLTLLEFTTRFEKYRETERDEGENPLADIKYNAVRVMTIHKAKGLEFPVVFLPNLAGGQKPSWDKPLVVRDWSHQQVGLRLSRSKITNAAMVDLEGEQLERETAEEVRVFYVAATRAKDQMFCFQNADARDGVNFARYLKKAPAELKPESYLWEKLTAKEPISPTTHSVCDWNVKNLNASLNERAVRQQANRSGWVSKSPTQLMQEPDKLAPVHEEEESLFKTSNAILIGLTGHRILERWDFLIDKKKISAAFNRIKKNVVRNFGVVEGTSVSAEIEKDVSEIMTGFFASPAYARLQKAKIIGREVPFLYPLEKNSTKHMRGVIDLLCEMEGELVIVDYKTNRVTENSISTAAQKYRPQAEAYTTALKKATGRKARFELLFLRSGTFVPIE